MHAADLLVARSRLEAKPRAGGEKLTTLADAVSRVKDGDHVAIELKTHA
jgi:hypothetical protein